MKTLGNNETNVLSLQWVIPKVHLTMFVDEKKGRWEDGTACFWNILYELLNAKELKFDLLTLQSLTVSKEAKTACTPPIRFTEPTKEIQATDFLGPSSVALCYYYSTSDDSHVFYSATFPLCLCSCLSYFHFKHTSFFPFFHERRRGLLLQQKKKKKSLCNFTMTAHISCTLNFRLSQTCSFTTTDVNLFEIFHLIAHEAQKFLPRPLRPFRVQAFSLHQH
jgi:hypothetical protein